MEFPYVVLVAHLKHTSLHEELILCKKNFKFAVSRNVEKLYRERENSDKRHRNSVVSRGLYSPISRNSLTEKHSKLSQIKLGRNDSSTEQNSRDVEQGSHCRNPKPLKGKFISNLFLLEKKDRGNRPVIKLKHLSQLIPYQHFKMEGLPRLQNIPIKGGYI